MKPIVILMAALLSGVTAAFFASKYVSTNRSAAILVAQGPITPGTSLADYEKLFAFKEVPPESLPAGFRPVTNAGQIKPNAVNLIVTKSLKAGDPLSLDDVVDKTKAGLSALLRPGTQAFAVSSNNAFVQAGDYVKVFGATKSADGKWKTVVLMKNIRVLALDRSGPSVLISLEVFDDETKKLQAQEKGTIALATMPRAEQPAPDKDPKDTDRKGE